MKHKHDIHKLVVLHPTIYKRFVSVLNRYRKPYEAAGKDWEAAEYKMPTQGRPQVYLLGMNSLGVIDQAIHLKCKNAEASCYNMIYVGDYGPQVFQMYKRGRLPVGLIRIGCFRSDLMDLGDSLTELRQSGKGILVSMTCDADEEKKPLWAEYEAKDSESISYDTTEIPVIISRTLPKEESLKERRNTKCRKRTVPRSRSNSANSRRTPQPTVSTVARRSRSFSQSTTLSSQAASV